MGTRYLAISTYHDINTHGSEEFVSPGTTVPAPDRHVSLTENQAAGGAREGQKVVLAALGFRA